MVGKHVYRKKKTLEKIEHSGSIPRLPSGVSMLPKHRAIAKAYSMNAAKKQDYQSTNRFTHGMTESCNTLTFHLD